MYALPQKHTHQCALGVSRQLGWNIGIVDQVQGISSFVYGRAVTQCQRGEGIEKNNDSIRKEPED